MPTQRFCLNPNLLESSKSSKPTKPTATLNWQYWQLGSHDPYHRFKFQWTRSYDITYNYSLLFTYWIPWNTMIYIDRIDIPCLCVFIYCHLLSQISHFKGFGPSASSKFHWLVQSTWRRAEESAIAFLKASPLAVEASWKCRSDCESTPGYLWMVTQCPSKMNRIEQLWVPSETLRKHRSNLNRSYAQRCTESNIDLFIRRTLKKATKKTVQRHFYHDLTGLRADMSWPT